MPFNSEGNTQAVFHSPDGDVKQEFMNSTGTNTYYRGEHFGATAKSLNHPEQMVFILPDEGYSPEDLLAEDSDLWDFLDAVGRETAALTGVLSLLASLGLALSLLALRTILTALPLALSSLALGTLP